MPVSKVTIEHPEGYEVVSYDVPSDDELWLDDDGSVIRGRGPHRLKRPILRKTYRWPEFIPPGHWLINHNGRWYVGIGPAHRSVDITHFIFERPDLVNDAIQKPVETSE